MYVSMYLFPKLQRLLLNHKRVCRGNKTYFLVFITYLFVLEYVNHKCYKGSH